MSHKIIVPLIIFVISVSDVFSQGLWQTAWDTIIVSKETKVLHLSNSLIDSSSLKIKKSGALKISSINKLNGEIVFEEPINTDTVIIGYRYLQIDIPNIYLKKGLPPIYSAAKSVNTNPGDEKGIKSAYAPVRSSDFLKSGSIFRSVSLGTNSSMAFRSGVDLQLDGEIGNGVKIIGVLSDQNTPIQPEGNTQTLDEIDKVYIRLESRAFKITMGDYTLNRTSGVFQRFNRKLTGIAGELNTGKNSFQFSGSVTKGEYTTNTFQGKEGVQGPYILTGRNGNKAIIVIAGTEKVWINGKLQTRGEKNDYVIDYSLGQLYFTPYKQITSDMRIAVEFQYSDITYNRNIFTVEDKVSLPGDRVNLSVGYISEADNASQPLETELSSEDKKLLKSVGDDESRAFVSTLQQDSAGAYIYENGILKYVGAGNGDHSAQFFHVGYQGEYRKVYAGEDYYFEYIDKTDPALSDEIKSQATYLPARPVKLPQSKRMLHFSGGIKPLNGLNIDVETAITENDKNQFSSLDDGDNKGMAYRLSTQYNMKIFKTLNVKLDGTLRRIDRRFSPFERIDEIEDNRYWNRPQSVHSGEDRHEITGLFTWKKNWEIGFSQGSLRSDDNFSADRFSWRSDYQGNIIENFHISQLYAKSRDSSAVHGKYNLGILNLGLRFKWLKPFTNFKTEEQVINIDEGFRFRQAEFGAVISSGHFEIRSSRTARDNLKLANASFVKDYNSNQDKISFRLNNIRNISSVFQLSKLLKRSIESGALSRETYHTLDFNLAKSPPRGKRSQWNFEVKLAEEKSPKKEYRYFKVQEGYGMFRYDSLHADYVPDIRGDYILRVFPSEILEPVSSLETGFRFRLLPASDREIFRKRFSLASQFRIEAKRRDSIGDVSAFVSGNYWNPFEGDSLLFLFRREMQQDLYYRPGKGGGFIHFSYKDRLNRSSQDVRGEESDHFRETLLGIKKTFSGNMTIEHTMKTSRKQRNSEFNDLRDRNISSLSTTTVLIFPRSNSTRIKSEITAGNDKNRTDLLKEKSIWVGYKQEIEIWLKRKGRGTAFFQTAYVKSGKDIPLEMADGFRPGINFRWGLRIDYRIQKSLTLSVDYRGWNEENEPTFHMGQAELRAFF